MGGRGPSLALRAFVAQNGPPDRFVRFANRSSRFKAAVLTKSATADLGRTAQPGDPSASEDGKHALSMFPAKPAWRCIGRFRSVFHFRGWVAEWFKAPVLKTGVAATPP
jgi:hypothetical protein